MTDGDVPSWVLDSSALLALLQNEPGAAVVRPAVDGAVISSVNWSEVVQKSLARGTEVAGLLEGLEAAGLTVLPFDADDADLAARLWLETRSYGLSLGDRACLATGLRARSPVLTADRSWTALPLGVEVRSIR